MDVMVFEQDERRGRVVGDLFEDIPGFLVREGVDSLLGGFLGANLGALLEALCALDAEADQGGDLADA